jgi:hypothetical protein
MGYAESSALSESRVHPGSGTPAISAGGRRASGGAPETPPAPPSDVDTQVLFPVTTECAARRMAWVWAESPVSLL